MRRRLWGDSLRMLHSTRPSSNCTAAVSLGFTVRASDPGEYVAALPRLAAVIAVERGDHGGPVSQVAGELPAAAVRHPNGCEEAAGLQLNAVAGSGGNDAPGIPQVEVAEHGRDLTRGGKGLAVVHAAHVQDACVAVAEEQMHGAAVRVVARVRHHHAVAERARAEVILRDDALRGEPCPPAIQAAAQKDIAAVPVASSPSAGLSAGEDHAARRAENAGYSVIVVAARTGLE